MARSEGLSRAEEAPRGHGELVLVIEDDPDVRFLVVAMVENLGYRVIDVSDAIEARGVLRRGEKIELVLSDIVLPGGTSGPEFAVEARAHDPNLKIIFMSGYSPEATERSGCLGSNDVLLNKPIRTEQLAMALRKAVDGDHSV